MKVEYLSHGSSDCPLVRIYGDERESQLRLQQAFRQLADGSAKMVALHRLPGFESVAGCQLTAMAFKNDVGVITEDEMCFLIKLSTRSWQELADKAASIIGAGGGTFYHWLDETSAISLLLATSPEGQW